ncbi:MAG: hypothetical protein U0R80_17365 [Nocardioidaceae bacterium]
MDTTPAHLVYDEADDPHDMACDCACACDNLHITPGTPEHLTHLVDCEAEPEICHLHIDDSTVALANSIHLHLD